MSIVKHLETNLGDIAEGWKDDANTDHKLRVVRFSQRPFHGASTFSTLGLSDTQVTLPHGKCCGQELLFAAWDRYPASSVASFLITLAAHISGRKRAILRGDVIGPSAPIIPGVAANAVYASNPVIYPDELATYGDIQSPTIFVWLVPLIGRECEIVRANGWSDFEDLIEQANPDLLDLDRLPLV